MFTVEGLEYKDLTPDMLNGRGIKARECRFFNEFVPQLIKTAGKLVTSKGYNVCRFHETLHPELKLKLKVKG